MSSVPIPNPELTCDECGRYGALDFGERALCLDCYETSGSCCPEFGRVEVASDAPKRPDPGTVG